MSAEMILRRMGIFPDHPQWKTIESIVHTLYEASPESFRSEAFRAGIYDAIKAMEDNQNGHSEDTARVSTDQPALEELWTQ